MDQLRTQVPGSRGLGSNPISAASLIESSADDLTAGHSLGGIVWGPQKPPRAPRRPQGGAPPNQQASSRFWFNVRKYADTQVIVCTGTIGQGSTGHDLVTEGEGNAGATDLEGFSPQDGRMGRKDHESAQKGVELVLERSVRVSEGTRAPLTRGGGCTSSAHLQRPHPTPQRLRQCGCYRMRCVNPRSTGAARSLPFSFRRTRLSACRGGRSHLFTAGPRGRGVGDQGLKLQEDPPDPACLGLPTPILKPEVPPPRQTGRACHSALLVSWPPNAASGSARQVVGKGGPSPSPFCRRR